LLQVRFELLVVSGGEYESRDIVTDHPQGCPSRLHHLGAEAMRRKGLLVIAGTAA